MATNDNEELVNVRELWKNEARDFTPWLADNLGLLGDALGMTLELVQKESPVGPYSLDILAKDTRSGVKVAIENQLGTTDHSHLGQLLTYATEHDARTVVWVAPAFVHEHAQALHRLNEWTNARECSFYGVKVEVVKKSATPPSSPGSARWCTPAAGTRT